MPTTARDPLLPTLGFLALSYFVAAAARADGAACKPVLDAMVKYVTTPSHTYSTSTRELGGGKTQKSEMISTGKGRFIMVDGNWIVNRMTDQEMLDIEKKNAQGRNLQCHAVRDESVAGESAALYAVHNETDGSKTDEQIWISHRSGLPLKLELDLHLDGAARASHMSSTMAYDNVKAPQGVK